MALLMRDRDPALDGIPAERPACVAVAALAAGAAAVHFAVVPPHLDESALHGAFFLALAWAQVLWAVAVMALRGRWLRRVLAVGAAAQVAVIGLWLVSRTSGLPGEAPEPVGVADVVATGLEAGAALVAVSLLTGRVAGRLVRRRAGGAAAGAAMAVVVAAASVGAAAAGAHEHAAGHEHVATAGVAAGGVAPGHDHSTEGAAHDHSAPGTAHDHGATAEAASAGDVPEGWVVGCPHRDHADDEHAGVGADDLGHGPGACTDEPVTTEQRARAEWVAAVTTAAVKERFATLEAAQAAGYRPVNISGPLWHVAHKTYQTDGALLDPQRVESLVYYVPQPGRSLLLGAMYIVDPPGVGGPLIGGGLTSWHSHTTLCVDPVELTAFNQRPDGTCAPGSSIAPTAEMLHVWTVPYEGGPFAEIDVSALVEAVTAAAGGTDGHH